MADTTAVTTYDPVTGLPVKTTSTTPGEEPPKKKVEDFGFSAKFLEKHGEVLDLIKLAIKEDWPEEKFFDRFQRDTTFGRNRFAAQELFDTAVSDPARWPDFQKRIDDQKIRLANEARQLGVQVTPEQIDEYARKIIRNDLGDLEVRAFLGKQFEVQPKAPEKGMAAQMSNDLVTTAADYGIAITDDQVQKRVRQGLASGMPPGTWLEEQKAYYRDQAKNLYPSVSDQLDRYSLKDILNPYLTEASKLLGLNLDAMNLDDSRWTKPLTGGADGTLMNANEWRTALRTNKTYGYGKTTQALNEAVDIGNEIMSIMGRV